MPKCPRDIVPKLSEENERFWFLAGRFLPGLHNGMGGFNYGAVRAVFDEYGVEGGSRPVLFDRAVALIRAYEDHREEKREQEAQQRRDHGGAA